MDRVAPPLALGAARRDPADGDRARLLPAARVDHSDDGADHPAAAQGRGFRPRVVRRDHDHRDGVGPDPSARGAQPVRDQEHRPGHPIARRGLGRDAVRGADDVRGRAAVHLPRYRDLVRRRGDGDVAGGACVRLDFSAGFANDVPHRRAARFTRFSIALSRNACAPSSTFDHRTCEPGHCAHLSSGALARDHPESPISLASHLPYATKSLLRQTGYTRTQHHQAYRAHICRPQTRTAAWSDEVGERTSAIHRRRSRPDFSLFALAGTQ